jgi:hypothetical protein
MENNSHFLFLHDRGSRASGSCIHYCCCYSITIFWLYYVTDMMWKCCKKAKKNPSLAERMSALLTNKVCVYKLLLLVAHKQIIVRDLWKLFFCWSVKSPSTVDYCVKQWIRQTPGDKCDFHEPYLDPFKPNFARPSLRSSHWPSSVRCPAILVWRLINTHFAVPSLVKPRLWSRLTLDRFWTEYLQILCARGVLLVFSGSLLIEKLDYLR